MRTVGYLRVSTSEQAVSGLGLEAQEKRVRAYAQLYGLELVELVVEGGASARTLERPGLRRALELLEDGRATALLVAKLDRLTRSVADLGELLLGPLAPERAQLLSVAENIDTRSAGGRLVLNVLVSVAQWEREAIAERTSAALQAKRARGDRLGAVAFGFRREDGALVPDVEEQRTLEIMRARRAEGAGGKAIARELNELGAKSKRGAPWTPSTVRAVLASDARRREGGK